MGLISWDYPFKTPTHISVNAEEPPRHDYTPPMSDDPCGGVGDGGEGAVEGGVGGVHAEAVLLQGVWQLVLRDANGDSSGELLL